jgi:hypothetical protein
MMPGGDRGGAEPGQASLLMLVVMTLLLGGVVVFFAFGQALGSKGRHQRAVDLAAVSGAQVMRDLYPRLFEPPVLANGLPNPRHLPLPVYLALARQAAVRGARRNGVRVSGADVSFPGAGSRPRGWPCGCAARCGCGRGCATGAGAAAARRSRCEHALWPRSPRTWARRSGCPRSAQAAATTARWPTGWGSP